MPEKLWGCDGRYHNLFTFMETEAKEMKLFIQVLYGVKSCSLEDNSDLARLLG